MNDPTIPALYGQTDETSESIKLNEATNDFEIKTQARNFARIKVGKDTVTVPKAQYAKELEDKLERVSSDLKKAEATNRQLKAAVTALTRDVADLRRDMKGKMDRFN